MELIDRDVEARELRRHAEADEKRMAILYGRRRVGKTRLLREIWPTDHRVLYFLASDATPAFNRRELVRTVAARDDTPKHLEPEDYPTWRTVFEMLFEQYPGEPLVVVLDEFQYLVGGEDDVRSQLAAIWDLHEADRPLLVVLCGSAIRTMEELGGGRAPLYGRLNWMCHLRPFDYWHAGQMTPYDSPRKRAIAYGVYGGTPRYLETLDAERPLRENIANAVLAPNGEVRSLVETVVEQERGFQAIHKYKSILTAVARGKTELSEIANFTGLEHDTALRKKLQKLRNLGLVERRRNFDAPSNAPYRHHLLEPSLRFHHSVVTSLRSALETTDPMQLWEGQIRPRLATHMGHVFEDMVEQAYSRLREERGLPILSDWGRWEGTDRNGKSLEIDIVARLVDGRMLTGGIKWSSEPIGGSLHTHHLRDLRRLADSGYGWAHDALHDDALLLFVSADGFREEFHRAVEFSDVSEHRTLAWTLDDLYSEDAAGPRNYPPRSD